MTVPVVTVKNLTKLFSIYHKPHEALLDLFPYFSFKIQKHTALDNISFEVYKGEFLGIIGQNGSGKSTLLKILCGVLHQTSGEIKINGKILSLLELGTGFNPDLTGRENLFVSASLMGFDTKLITERLSEIEAFADIEEYFDAPVKTYSSGMYVRLAMAMFLHLEPEIFIIDEALSVGDIFFQQKCFAKIEEMRQRGVTFILVSHDLGLIAKVCDRVAYLEHGKLLYIGDRTTACKLYYDSHRKTPLEKNISDQIAQRPCSLSNGINLIANKIPSIQTDKAAFSYLRITNLLGDDTLTVEMMSKVRFEMGAFVDDSLALPGVSLLFKDRTGTLISGITHHVDQRGNLSIVFEVALSINAGDYSIEIYMGERDDENSNTGKTLCCFDEIGPLRVTFDFEKQIAPFYGMCYLENNFNILKDTNA